MHPASPVPAASGAPATLPALRWRCAPLHALHPLELHRIHRARQAVFVVEQSCAFQDADAADEACWHLSAWRLAAPEPAPGAAPGASLGDTPVGGADDSFLQALATGQAELLAYARLVPPGVKYTEASIGRVITTAAARGTGLGRALVARALAEAARLFPGHSLRIGAQSRLEAFYEAAGFQVVSERYLEDGIDHTEMWRPSGP